MRVKMTIVLKHGYTDNQIENFIKSLKSNYKVTVNKIITPNYVVLSVTSNTLELDLNTISKYEIVESITQEPHELKKVSRNYKNSNTTITLKSKHQIGNNNLTLIAGPCSVESLEQICSIAKDIKKFGANCLRGGAFKPRTSPYSFQGLKKEGIELLIHARNLTGLPIVSEITDIRHLDLFENIDIIQIGARNMQNFELLKEMGKLDKPILLKRGMSNTIEELLMSAEYIISEGNSKIILCERGIRTFEPYTRNTLDISAIPILKRLSHLPVIVDPSHASGIPWLIEPLSMAAVSCGADGIIVEVHNHPESALSDGYQSITPYTFKHIVSKLLNLKAFLNNK